MIDLIKNQLCLLQNNSLGKLHTDEFLDCFYFIFQDGNLDWKLADQCWFITSHKQTKLLSLLLEIVLEVFNWDYLQLVRPKLSYVHNRP